MYVKNNTILSVKCEIQVLTKGILCCWVLVQPPEVTSDPLPGWVDNTVEMMFFYLPEKKEIVCGLQIYMYFSLNIGHLIYLCYLNATSEKYQQKMVSN